MSPRIVAALIVGTVAVAGFLAYRKYVENHDARILEIEFAVGTPREHVISELGEPDQELQGEAIRKYAASFGQQKCLEASAKVLRYWGKSDTGAFCSVFLDRKNRVICVEHGLIAY